MWEYKASTIPQEYFMLDDILKSYSQTDWELVTIIPTHSRRHDGKYISLVFKRLTPSKNDCVELANTVLDVLHIVQNLQKDTECQP